MNFDLALFEATLSKSIRAWGLSCSQEALDLMGQFALQIIEVNQGLNLTRILEPEEMAIKNFLDSLSLLLMEWPQELSCLDVGTGAGFPGIPLAMCRSQWSLVLLDSLRKRLNFLEDVAGKLRINNVSTLHARAEDAGQDGNQRESYDLVVSRAVASLPVLLELCSPLVKVGGHFVAFKASEADLEVAQSTVALRELNVELEQTFPIELPLAMGERRLLVFRKTKRTPASYPRRPGLPAKRPLS